MSVTPPAPREFQRKFDASWRELYPEQAHQVRWAVTAQSELLLSPLLAAPFQPGRVADGAEPLLLPAVSVQLVANATAIDTVTCVNFSGVPVAAPPSSQDPPMTPPAQSVACDTSQDTSHDTSHDPSHDTSHDTSHDDTSHDTSHDDTSHDTSHDISTQQPEVTELSAAYYLKKRGTRVIMSKADYLKQAQKAPTPPQPKPRENTMAVTAVRSVTPTLLHFLLTAPALLLFGHSAAFQHLLRSLVLTHKAAVLSFGAASPLLLPLTTTSAYLFFVDETPPLAIGGMEPRECRHFLEDGTTDLFLVWEHVLGGHNDLNP